MMYQTAQDPAMQACIDACQQCHAICLQTAMTHCLRAGGKHVEERHLRLMMNCQEICQTAANFMSSQSELHGAVCGACAEVCDACADSCEQVGDMDECVRACHRCAQACADMAGSYQPRMGARAGGLSPGANI